jgi:hypothetical protein
MDSKKFNLDDDIPVSDVRLLSHILWALLRDSSLTTFGGYCVM